MKNDAFKLMILLQVATLFLVGMSFIYHREPSATTPLHTRKLLEEKNSKACNQQSLVQEKVRYENLFTYGDLEAPNELIVFSRFNCTYCKQFYRELFPYLQNEYVATGLLKITFILNANPLDEHEIFRAKALEVSKKLNLYESMQRAFYDDESQKDSLFLVNFLKKEGVHEEVWEERLKDQSILEQVQRQLKEGERLAVTGTPTFFVNGYRMVGYDDKDQFLKFLTAYLNHSP